MKPLSDAVFIILPVLQYAVTIKDAESHKYKRELWRGEMNNLTNYVERMGEITATVHNLLHIEIILFKQIALDPKGNEQRNGCIEKQVEDYVYAT